MEVQSTKSWQNLREGDYMYSEGFTRKKWVLGFFMLTRGALWFIHMIR